MPSWIRRSPMQALLPRPMALHGRPKAANYMTIQPFRRRAGMFALGGRHKSLQSLDSAKEKRRKSLDFLHFSLDSLPAGLGKASLQLGFSSPLHGTMELFRRSPLTPKPRRQQVELGAIRPARLG